MGLAFRFFFVAQINGEKANHQETISLSSTHIHTLLQRLKVHRSNCLFGLACNIFAIHYVFRVFL